jgi:hypothetical protein
LAGAQSLSRALVRALLAELSWDAAFLVFAFRDADAHGLNLSRAIGTNTWSKAQSYFQGIAAG